MVYSVKSINFVDKSAVLQCDGECVTVHVSRPHEAALLLFRRVKYADGILTEAA